MPKIPSGEISIVICALGEDDPLIVKLEGDSFLLLVNEVTVSVGGSDAINGVGVSVGKSTRVGLAVAIGVVVGRRVGVIVGRRVGVTVGRNPPTPDVGVGVLVGVLVGEDVGVLVGVLAGVRLGVGLPVGVRVGVLVGVAVACDRGGNLNFLETAS